LAVARREDLILQSAGQRNDACLGLVCGQERVGGSLVVSSQKRSLDVAFVASLPPVLLLLLQLGLEAGNGIPDLLFREQRWPTGNAILRPNSFCRRGERNPAGNHGLG